MTQINDYWQLEKAYEILNRWNQLFSEMGENPNDLDFVQETKREIRRFNKRIDEFHEVVLYRHENDEWFYYRELVKLPEWVETKAEANEWFMENIFIEYHPKPWDCTGQWFTSWYYLFKRNGNWMAYHSVNQDV